MFIKKIDDENRQCLYCNTNIGYKKLSAKICDNIECVKKLQADIKKNPIKNIKRNCIICGCDISMLPSQSKTCTNPECKKEKLRQNYKLHRYVKKCSICGIEFEGTQKQKVCEHCKKNSSKRRIENITKTEQKVFCKQCGELIRTELKNNVRHIPDVIYELCNTCNKIHKQQIYKESSNRMKLNNPMFNEDIRKKVGNTQRKNYVKHCYDLGIIPNDRNIKKDIKETYEESIIRMKTNNPMFNKKTVEKMKQTLQKHIQDGTVTYKHGVDSPLWKGNRLLNKSVRIALRHWVKQMFEKYEYTCQVCGKQHTELHVHHIEPLRDIITKFLIKYNYTTEYIQSQDGTNIYDEFIQDIVQYHLNNDNIGIVVCPECHYEMDKYYNKKKHD